MGRGHRLSDLRSRQRHHPSRGQDHGLRRPCSRDESHRQGRRGASHPSRTDFIAAGWPPKPSGGLPDRGPAIGSTLTARLDKDATPIPSRAEAWCSPEVPPAEHLLPEKFGLATNGDGQPGFCLATLGRMLFSCLVDADFIATERFYLSLQGSQAPRNGPSLLTRIDDMTAVFDAHMAAMHSALPEDRRPPSTRCAERSSTMSGHRPRDQGACSRSTFRPVAARPWLPWLLHSLTPNIGGSTGSSMQSRSRKRGSKRREYADGSRWLRPLRFSRERGVGGYLREHPVLRDGRERRMTASIQYVGPAACRLGRGLLGRTCHAGHSVSPAGRI